MVTKEENKFKKKHKGKSGKIIFDDEVITRDVATKLIQKADVNKEAKKSLKKRKKPTENVLQSDISSELTHIENPVEPKRKRSKRGKKKPSGDTNSNEETVNDNTNAENQNSLKKKHSKIVDEDETDITNDPGIESEILNVNSSGAKKVESIRARKKRRHMELLQEKKLRSGLNLQQKCLNYLSMWKCSKLQWKFEKLKQIWLQQNMFDDAKVPDKFWDILVEYFSNAKGQVKSKILNEAVKIVDSVQDMDEESSEKMNIKHLRARNIVQNLQE